MAVPPFQRFLDEHGPAVHGFLVASVGRTEADDCFQETFLAALRAYPRLQHADNLRSWALTIAHRKAIDAPRARGRRPVPTDAMPERPAGTKDGEPALRKRVDDLPEKHPAEVRTRSVQARSRADIER